jgi:hypothetical protein
MRFVLAVALLEIGCSYSRFGSADDGRDERPGVVAARSRG